MEHIKRTIGGLFQADNVRYFRQNSEEARIVAKLVHKSIEIKHLAEKYFRQYDLIGKIAEIFKEVMFSFIMKIHNCMQIS